MEISFLNLNIMHGRNRKSAIFPIGLSLEEIKNNLCKIADLITKHNPDIVTLQEIDQFSILSGGFNQSEFLNEKLNYPYKYNAPSCSIKLFGKKIFVSGTAIYSKYPLENCESYNFGFSFPTDRMGFIISDIKLPENKKLSVISLHLVYLDWLRYKSRSHQLKLVEKVVKKRNSPTVIAGDFNCDYSGKEKTLFSFIQQFNLNIYDTENKNTYPSWEPTKHIDWVLLPKELTFKSHETIEDIVSDHLAIYTVISI